MIWARHFIRFIQLGSFIFVSGQGNGVKLRADGLMKVKVSSDDVLHVLMILYCMWWKTLQYRAIQLCPGGINSKKRALCEICFISRSYTDSSWCACVCELASGKSVKNFERGFVKWSWTDKCAVWNSRRQNHTPSDLSCVNLSYKPHCYYIRYRGFWLTFEVHNESFQCLRSSSV